MHESCNKYIWLCQAYRFVAFGPRAYYVWHIAQGPHECQMIRCIVPLAMSLVGGAADSAANSCVVPPALGFACLLDFRAAQQKAKYAAHISLAHQMAVSSCLLLQYAWLMTCKATPKS